MQKLSEFFTLEELTVSDYAVRHGIDNTPSLGVLANLTRTALEMDKVRRLLGRPCFLSSAHRCLELNRAIGSEDYSQHVKGEAVDFTCPGFGTVKQVFEKIDKSCIDFDQMILEYGRWVHISFRPGKNRRERITYNGNTYVRLA